VASIPVSVGAQPRNSEFLYRSIVTVANATCKVMRWDLTVAGEQHIPRQGPAVIASNHIGVLDFVFLGFAGHSRGRLVRFMAKQEVFDHWLAGPLLRGMRHIPVDRVGDPAAAYRHAIRALGEGEVVGIHPEGKINRSLVPTHGKTGAARMALATAAPLIPAAVWGSHRVISPRKGRGFLREVTISVQVGAPLVVEPGIEADALTDRLMERIRGLWIDAVRVERGSRIHT
jgi:1-acyl-sn-glycerol-3-phosphate acyltransferase